MLPVYSKDSVSGKPTRISEKISNLVRLILSDRNSRNLFLFTLLNLCFAFVELLYGIWSNSLGLISDSFHMFFDCYGLVAGLAASIITKWKPNERYSYGYVRAEVIAGFCNGLLLIYIGFYILSEAVERLMEPPEVKHDRLMLVSVLGLLVNLVGIYAFQHGHGHSHGGMSHGHSHGGGGHSHSSSHSHSHGGHSHSDSSHGHSHNGHFDLNQMHIEDHEPENNNLQGKNSHIMQGVFLHILADTLGSVAVIVSSFLMWAFGWLIADPVCSIFIAVLICVSVIPLIRDTVEVLLMRTPRELEGVLGGCYQRVMQLEGVFSVQEPHFWTLCSDVFVGAIKLEVAKNADPRYIISQTHNIFNAIGVRQLYVQLDYSLT
jgi:zinc transporter 5/7